MDQWQRDLEHDERFLGCGGGLGQWQQCPLRRCGRYGLGRLCGVGQQPDLQQRWLPDSGWGWRADAWGCQCDLDRCLGRFRHDQRESCRGRARQAGEWNLDPFWSQWLHRRCHGQFRSTHDWKQRGAGRYDGSHVGGQWGAIAAGGRHHGDGRVFDDCGDRWCHQLGGAECRIGHEHVGGRCRGHGRRTFWGAEWW